MGVAVSGHGSGWRYEWRGVEPPGEVASAVSGEDGPTGRASKVRCKQGAAGAASS